MGQQQGPTLNLRDGTKLGSKIAVLCLAQLPVSLRFRWSGWLRGAFDNLLQPAFKS